MEQDARYLAPLMLDPIPHFIKWKTVNPSIDASPQSWSHVSSFPAQERTLHDVTDELIKSLVLEALRSCEGNRRHAARVLGIARDSLYRHMKRFGIDGDDPTTD